MTRYTLTPNGLAQPNLKTLTAGGITPVRRFVLTSTGLVPLQPAPVTLRDRLARPFASTSPYNTAIGSGAIFAHPFFVTPSHGFFSDTNPNVATPSAAPVTVTENGSFDSTTGYQVVSTSVLGGLSPGSSMLGDLAGMSPGDLAEQIASMRSAGISYLRIDSGYGGGSGVGGPYDVVVRAAITGGLIPLVLLIDYTGEWAASGFGAWCGPAAAHYQALGVEHYEVGNEVNMGGNWRSGACSPSAYTACLQSAYAQIKAVDATATVLASGLAAYGQPTGAKGGTNMNQVDFFLAMYASGVAGHFDAANVHPYLYRNFSDGDKNAGYPTEVSGYNPWYVMDQMYAAMLSHGDGTKKIWYTEFGVPTGSAGGYPAYSTAQQAQSFTDAFMVANSKVYSGPLFSYAWHDSNGSDGDFGLYTSTGVAKPALSSFQTAAGVPFRVPIGPFTMAQSNGNLSGGVVLEDGNTVQELAQFSVATGANIRGYGAYGTLQLDGDGITFAAGPPNPALGNTTMDVGAHGGSGLSGFAGSIRTGELLSGPGPAHVLQLTCDLNSYGYQPGDVGTQWHQWPAAKADGEGAYGQYAPAGSLSSGEVGGIDWAVGEGTMLAIPSATTIASLGLLTAPGQRMAWALQNYGCYVVDNAGGSSTATDEGFGLSSDALSEFESTFGPFGGGVAGSVPTTSPTSGSFTDQWQWDLNQCFCALQVVVNNSPDTIGGGGTPLQPPLPGLS